MPGPATAIHCGLEGTALQDVVGGTGPASQPGTAAIVRFVAQEGRRFGLIEGIVGGEEQGESDRLFPPVSGPLLRIL